MANKIEKCNMEKIHVLEDPSSIKKEVQQNYFENVKVHISESGNAIGRAELQDNTWANKIKQEDLPTTVVDIKTELSSSEVQCNMMIDNIKIESGISGGDDIKIECDNGLLLYCDQCNAYYEDYCINCGMLIHILNNNILSNIDGIAQEELPYNILAIQDSFDHFGIFALKVIPEGIRFGPFTKRCRSECPWKIKGGKIIVSATETTYLNWMQHVNSAKNSSEQNLCVFQFEGNLYYKSSRRIQKGEELLVHFGDEYKDSLSDDIEMDFIPCMENIFVDVFACTLCCLGFSSKSYLAKHKTICLADVFGGFSIEDLTQCQFCKIHLAQKEYVKHHMAFCSERNVRIYIQPVPKRALHRQVHKRQQCNSRTKYKGDLVSRTNKHCKVKMYKCKRCNRRFGTQASLTLHSETAHAGAGIKEEPKYSIDDYVNAHIEVEYMNAQDEMQQGNRSVSEFHLQRSNYKCDTCEFKTNRKKYLEMHVKSKHLNEFDYKCDLCDYKTNRKDQLANHIKVKHLKQYDYKCDLCEFITKRNDYLEKHIKSKHLKQFDYKCDSCEFKTNIRHHLKQHIKAKHLKKFDFKCEWCEFSTSLKASLDRHVKTKHLNELDYKCQSCNFRANRKDHLEKHIKIKHLNEFDHRCDSCDFKTNRKDSLEIHVKTKHLKEFDYKCDLCELRTNSRDHLKKHIKAKHLMEFDYKCDSCDFRTNRKDRLEEHIKVKHLKEFDFKCDWCKFRTSFEASLDQHVKTKHLNEFDYKCESCDYRTNRKNCLEIHVKSKHLKEFDYKCDSCDLRTNRKDYLKFHMKTKHLKEFDFKCDSCDFRTNRKDYLKVHMKTKHLKEFDYKCDSCDFRTNQKDYLKVHMKSKHLKEFDYKCGACDFKTNLKDYLKVHMKTKHLQGLESRL